MTPSNHSTTSISFAIKNKNRALLTYDGVSKVRNGPFVGHVGGELIVEAVAHHCVALPHKLRALLAVKSIVLQVNQSASQSLDLFLSNTYYVGGDFVVNEFEAVDGSERLDAEAHVVRYIIVLEHRVERVAVDSNNTTTSVSTQ